MIPKVDLYEEDGEFVIEADLPGFSPAEIEVNVGRDRVVIRGCRGLEAGTQRADCAALHRQERHLGRFEREIPLPESVLREAARATLRAGVLRVQLVIAKPAPPLRKLPVQPGADGIRHLELARG